MKGFRLAILAVVAFSALAVPTAAFACAGAMLPGESNAEPVGTMHPSDEPNIVPAATQASPPAAIEVVQPVEPQERTTFLRLTRDDQAEASFVLAALAPVIFALLTIGAYALSRRQ